MNPAMVSSKNPCWNTPKDFYEMLNKEFNFNDDPCPLGGIFGLDREWGTSTYCNPPYGPEIKEWLEKGIAEWQLGKTIVFLLPARTDTKWFHELVLPNATEIRFIKGRLKFDRDYKSSIYHRTKYSAPFPSMLIIFGKKDE